MRRDAFTLIELLLALALTAVLMAGLYGALELYRRMTFAGQIDVERAQLARAVLLSIKRDLNSVVPDVPPAATATTDGAPATSTPGIDPAAMADTGETTLATAASLYGTLETLELKVSKPAATGAIDLAKAATITGDLRSVSWILAVPNAPGLQGAVGNLSAGGSILMSRDSAPQGLARLEGDWQELDLLRQEAQLQLLAEQAQIVAPEIAALEFSYFDGTAWVQTWDSATMGSLPRAVEIMVGFGPKEETEAQAETTGTSREVIVDEWYRLVVAMPSQGAGTPAAESTAVVQ